MSLIGRGIKAVGRYVAKNALKVSVGEPKAKAGIAGAIKSAYHAHTGSTYTGIGAAAESLGADGARMAKGFKDAYKENFAGVGLLKKTDATFYNGYTGLKPSALGNTLGLGAVGATSLYGIGKVVAEPVSGPVQYEGEAPIMTADGMGSGTKAPTMNASGSLVFGLNSMRRG